MDMLRADGEEEEEEEEEAPGVDEVYFLVAEAWRQASVTARPSTREEMATIWKTMRWACFLFWVVGLVGLEENDSGVREGLRWIGERFGGFRAYHEIG